MKKEKKETNDEDYDFDEELDNMISRTSYLYNYDSGVHVKASVINNHSGGFENNIPDIFFKKKSLCILKNNDNKFFYIVT